MRQLKILKITWRTPKYIQKLFSAYGSVETDNYETLRNFVYSDLMGTSDAWGDGLRRLGYDALDIPIGIPALDFAWWREFGSGGPPPKGAQITQSILQYHNPDILIVEGIENFSPEKLNKIREWLPRLKCLVGTSGNEITYPEIYNTLDVFISNRPTLVDAAKATGVPALFLSHGFDDRVNTIIGSMKKSRAIVFTGLIHSGEKYHERRLEILEEISREIGLDVFTDSSLKLLPALREYLFKLGAYHVAHTWSLIGLSVDHSPVGRKLRTALSWSRPPRLNWSRELSGKVHPGVYGLDMFRVVGSALVAINVQPGNSDGSATNMRMFEAAGVGTCLITDASADLANYYSEDEMVTFTSASEAVSMAREFLHNPEMAIAIGKKAQSRTLAEHTYAKRMVEFIAFLKQYL